MIENENETFRITVIMISFLSIVASFLILLLICQIKQLHERQGHSIQIVLILELVYSFFLLFSQFYYNEPDIIETTFYISSEGTACTLIGVFSVSTSFAYFTAINFYSLESLEIFTSKFAKNYRLRHLAILSCSAFFGLLAYTSKSIGYSQIGMCALQPGNAFNYFLLILTCITFVIILWTFIEIFRLKKALGNDITAQIQNYKYKVNLVYIISFLIVRVIPVLVLSIISISISDSETFTVAFYIFAIPLSIGGLLLSIIRCKEPTIKDFLNRQFSRQKSGIVELSQPQELKVQELSCSAISNDSQIIKPHYLSYFQGTTRDNSIAYRKTCLDNEDMVARLTQLLENNQVKCKLKDYLLIFKVIREMINQKFNKPIKLNTIITSYYMKYMRQKILYFDDQDSEFHAQEIICTSYAEALFEKILSIETYKFSFDGNLNKEFINSLINTRSEANSLTTYDGEIIISIIHKQAKIYLTRCVLKEYFEIFEKGSKSFLPPMIGLFSIVTDQIQYAITVEKNLLNSIKLTQMGFKTIGCFTYQMGQVDAEIKGGTEIYQKIKMNNKTKQEFIDILNNDLTILRDKYLWGYSFVVLYIEHEDSTKFIPNSFRTRNGFVLASLGGVMDQFWIDNYQAKTNPELYASQLAQQIDLLF